MESEVEQRGDRERLKKKPIDWEKFKQSEYLRFEKVRLLRGKKRTTGYARM